MIVLRINPKFSGHAAILWGTVKSDHVTALWCVGVHCVCVCQLLSEPVCFCVCVCWGPGGALMPCMPLCLISICAGVVRVCVCVLSKYPHVMFFVFLRVCPWPVAVCRDFMISSRDKLSPRSR